MACACGIQNKSGPRTFCRHVSDFLSSQRCRFISKEIAEILLESIVYRLQQSEQSNHHDQHGDKKLYQRET